jgi:hypothetical protein
LTKYFSNFNEAEWETIGKFFVESIGKEPAWDGVVHVTHFELNQETKKSHPSLIAQYCYMRGMFLAANLVVKYPVGGLGRVVTYQYIDETGSNRDQTESIANDMENNRILLVRRDGEIIRNISINSKTAAFPSYSVQYWHTDRAANLIYTHKEAFVDGEGNFGEKKEHRGVMISLKDGTKYEGEIRQTFQYHGKGVLTSREPSSVLDGYFEDGYISHGTLETEDFSYTGEFKTGIHSGKGSIIYKNGDKYEGDFVNSRMEGFGKYTYVNGDYYEGYFSGNYFHGQGKYVFGNGAYMEGEFQSNDLVSGKMQIPATSFEITKDLAMSLSQGFPNFFGALVRAPIILWLKLKNLFSKEPVMVEEYEGGLNSEREYQGMGKHRDMFGNYYEGNFINNEKSGKGRYIYSGNEYIGEFKNNNLHGQGKLMMKNGDYYIGGFKEGNYEGYGKLVSKGKVKKGVWKEGKLVEDHSNDNDDNDGSPQDSTESKKTDTPTNDKLNKFSPVRLSLRAGMFSSHLPVERGGLLAGSRHLLNQRAMSRIMTFRSSQLLIIPRSVANLRLLRRIRIF